MDEELIELSVIKVMLAYITNHVSYNDIDELFERISVETGIDREVLNFCYYEEED